MCVNRKRWVNRYFQQILFKKITISLLELFWCFIHAPHDQIFQLAVKNEITILYERKVSHKEKNIPAPRE